MKIKFLLSILLFSIACEAQLKPTSNFGRTKNRGTSQAPLINLDTYFDVLNLQGNTFNNFVFENPNLCTRWTDLSPNANHATQSTQSQKPIYNINGGTQFDGVNDGFTLGSEITLTNGTIFLVLKTDADAPSAQAISCANTDQNNILLNNYLIETIVNNGAEVGDWQLGGNGYYKIVTIRKNGTTWTAKYNDRIMCQGAVGITLSNGSIKIKKIGLSGVGVGFLNGNVKAFMAHSTALGDATCRDIVTTLMARYNVAGTSDVSVVGFGDSITQNQVAYPVLPDVGILMGLPIINCALTGTKASNASGAVNNGQDRCASMVVNRPYVDKIFIFFGANDIGDGGISTTDFGNAYTSMVNTLTSAGYPASNICLVSPPYTSGYQTTTFTRTNDFRTAVLNVATTLHTHYADVLQALLDTGDPNSYMFDGLHPTVAGAQIYANTIYAGFLTPTL